MEIEYDKLKLHHGSPRIEYRPPASRTVECHLAPMKS